MSKRKPENSISSFFVKKTRVEPDSTTSENELSFAASPTPKGQRKSGIDQKWKTTFPWLTESSDGKGMLCQLCIKYQRRPKKCAIGRAVWVDIPCTSIRLSSCKAHKDSESHKEACVFDAAATTSVGGIESGFVREVDINRAALKSSMTVLYMLCKEEIAHTTKYEPVMEVVKHLGCEVLEFLNKGENQKYTPMRHIKEVVQLFGDMIWNKKVNEISESPYYSVLIDETTDVSTTSQLIVYVRYLKAGKSETVFAKVIEIPNGRSNTILEAVLKFLSENNLPLEKLCAFGSDGAAAMVGSSNGVTTQLPELVPPLIANHCVAHRLALASAQAASAVPYLMKFKRVLEQLFRFYHKSAVRSASLKEIQNVLNEPRVKVMEAKDVRWLSHEKAVTAVRRCLPSIVASLEYEATEKCDAQAAGLSMFLQHYEFVAALYMMSDILPLLSKLSCKFQTRDETYSNVGSLVAGTITTVQSLKANPGNNFQQLPVVMTDLTSKPYRFKQPTDAQVSQFRENVYNKFIDSVVSNLEKRFPNIDLLDAFCVFKPQTWPEDQMERDEFGKEEIQMLADRFCVTLPTPEDVRLEFRLAKNTIYLNATLQKMTVSATLEEIAGNMTSSCPNLARIAAVGLLIPASTADCERGFSAMKRIKTEQRNRMSADTLNALLMIAVQGPPTTSFPYDEAVNKWGKEKPRRLTVV